MKTKLIVLSALTFAIATAAFSNTASASACDVPGECKGVTETIDPTTYPPTAPTTPSSSSSASGCWKPGGSNCKLVQGFCECDFDTAPKNEEEELGFLCITSEKCMVGEVIVVNGQKACVFHADPACNVEPTPPAQPSAPGTPSTPTTPSTPATPVTPSDPASVPTTPASDPTTSGPTTVPLPATPPAAEATDEGFCDDLPLEHQACCEAVGGSPLDFMKSCLKDETRASDCEIVVEVAGDLGIGEKSQVNVCCNSLKNSGSIADSTVVQQCENTFGPAADAKATPQIPSTSPETHDVKDVATPWGGGCSLIR